MTVPNWKSGLQEIADGVFAYINAQPRAAICNSGIIIGGDGVMVIDGLMVGSMVRPYLEQIRKVTSKPIRYVVNTHHHIDHSFGNQFYLPAEVLGHRACRKVMLAKGVDQEDLGRRFPMYKEDWLKVRLTPPSVTYEDKMVVHLGDRVVELLHPGAAHTYGDTLIYMPKEKVLFTGDVAFQYLTPLAADGHISHWIRVEESIINNLDAITIVPGHGPVADKTPLVQTLGYLKLLRRTSRLHFRRGASAEDAARAMRLGEYADWEEPERVLRNMERAFQEFRGELPKPSTTRFEKSLQVAHC